MKHPFNLSPFLLSLLILGACGDADSPNNSEPKKEKVLLQFSANIDGKQVDCESEYTLGMSASPAKLADARFFISTLEYRNSKGDWVEMTLDEDNWQHKNVALLDFENAKGACKDSGTPETHTKVSGSLTPGNYDKVRFSLGIPFELNHVDNATAPAPLNTPGMYWVWQGGHKFLRIDWIVENGVLPRFNTHLGSTHCVSTGPTAPPEQRCANPNMATFEFDITGHQNNKVSLNLNNMFSKTDLGVNVMDTPPGCQSSPMEAGDCDAIFSALGMAFSTGKCEGNCSNQKTFSVTEQP